MKNKVELPKEKMFVIRKYVMAKSARQAILKDKTAPVDDVFIDTDWQRGQTAILASSIGFSADMPNQYD